MHYCFVKLVQRTFKQSNIQSTSLQCMLVKRPASNEQEITSLCKWSTVTKPSGQ